MKAVKGKPKPLGPTESKNGINFALFSKHATKVTLIVEFEEREIEFPLCRTGDIWHGLVEGLKAPFLYSYKVDGPHGYPHYFHPHHFLSDPYSKSVNTTSQWADRDQHYHPKSVFLPTEEFDWQGVTSPHLKMKDLVIYEMHVRGFTKHPSSKVDHPGTFLGAIEKIPYLKNLGINAVELMPIQEFNECGYHRRSPITGSPLSNYFGYSTVNFFSPMNRYATDFRKAASEFKTLVRELHRNGIEVILDVVFNHTGEKSKEEGLYSFMGIDHSVYYMLLGGHHANFTGCGHTMNLNHPVVRQFVKDVLHYWVVEMQVDGFRFDLASIMNRDQAGKLLAQSPLIQDLTLDPILSRTKLIAEPWDLGGYQLGGFSPQTKRWSEWNGKYRDAVRSFIKGDPHSKNEFATRIAGSEDLFGGRSPSASINFVTAHDGFTLRDLVSYNEKHNESNGEHNKDGAGNNFSWNMGEEGETDNQEILNLRTRQMKNFIVALMISRGTPMLLMRDEYGHTKNGNNNTWCQDNELSWFLWDQLSPFTEFVRNMIEFRKEHLVLQDDTFYTDQEILWHGINLEDPNWGEESPIISFTIQVPDGKQLYMAFNATGSAITFNLPTLPEEKIWHLVVDTNASPPDDFLASGKEKQVGSPIILLQPYSSVILKAALPF